MKVQCSKCQSAYKIDDNKIPESGAKFKCTQCENVFEVKKTTPEPSFFPAKESTENTKPERTLNVNTSTSITDKPIKSIDENLLGIENYATALTEFVLESATPLTIGMQGEWGTGKTSLMYLVREKLDNTQDDNKVATSWVNTWEYSLFREPFQITPSVLKGLLENLEQTCKDLGYWEKNRIGTKQKVSSKRELR